MDVGKEISFKFWWPCVLNKSLKATEIWFCRKLCSELGFPIVMIILLAFHLLLYKWSFTVLFNEEEYTQFIGYSKHWLRVAPFLWNPVDAISSTKLFSRLVFSLLLKSDVRTLYPIERVPWFSFCLNYPSCLYLRSADWFSSLPIILNIISELF